MANIPFSPPDITEAEIAEVCEALRSGWITTGPRTKEFERRLAEYCGTQKVACLNSATAALELNLRVLGIGEGDEVIVPAYTYTASASAVAHVGAKIIFIDCMPDSFEMDYEQLEKIINNNRKTKNILIKTNQEEIRSNKEDINKKEIIKEKKRYMEFVLLTDDEY